MNPNLRKRLHRSQLRVFTHLLGVFPLLWLIWDGWMDNLTINPVQALTQRTGRYAIFFLILSLSCTPVNTVFGYRKVLKIRRTLGLYAFLYAALHFLLFVGIDYQFNLNLLSEVIFEKPYALVGLAAFTILLVLAVTSYKYWMKKLGKWWKKLHRFVYLAGVLVVIHYFWVAKGDLLRLSGDIQKPLIYAVILVVLLGLRLPVVRKYVVYVRQYLAGRGKREKPAQQPAAHE